MSASRKVAVRLPLELVAELERKARHEGRTFSAEVRYALTRHAKLDNTSERKRP